MSTLSPGDVLFSGNVRDPLRAGLPGKSRLKGMSAFGRLVGNSRGMSPDMAINSKNWLATLNSGTVAQAVAAATAAEEMTITTNAAALAVAQLQESFDGGTTAVLRYVPLAGTVIAFGGTFKLSEVTTKGFMFGLSAIDTTMMSAAVLDVSDFVGFYSTTADAAKLYGTMSTGSSPVNSANLQTMVAATYYKLEVRINGVTGVEFFVDGTRTAAAAAAIAKIPTAGLAFSIAMAANAKTCIGKNIYCYQWGVN
jgi:hypothetical protein